MHDAVKSVFESVSADAYILDSNGQRIPQSSSPKIIAATLRLLDVPSGARILEIGTGSGYSTALLAHLVGGDGSVVSLDIDADLAKRANRLLVEHNLSHAKAVPADGRDGYPSSAPFDFIVAWATADFLPQAWIEQLCPGGVVVAPVRLLRLASTTAVVRICTDGERNPVGEEVISGAFVPLTSEPLSCWHGPGEDADVKTEAPELLKNWASAEWMQCEEGTKPAEQILQLMQALSPQLSPLGTDEDVDALRAYLLATNPRGLTTASTQVLGPAIGCSQPGSLALLSLCGEGYASMGECVAAADFASWVSDWRAAECPGFKQLRPITECTQYGWRVHVVLSELNVD